MHREITLQKQQIAYTLKKSDKARRVRLAVRMGGDVVVTIPRSLSERVVEKFIAEKTSWLLKKLGG
jgi:predicted metal-dependent hydrolase